jgi:DNA replicative helicase MCM subunit Mcm2 (Cdc46/Mcm family)
VSEENRKEGKLMNDTKDAVYLGVYFAGFFIGKAPMPVIGSEINDIMKLDDDDLSAIGKLFNKDSITDDDIQEIAKKSAQPEVFERLFIARRIARSVRGAEEAGLYDALEHQACEALG